MSQQGDRKGSPLPRYDGHLHRGLVGATLAVALGGGGVRLGHAVPRPIHLTFFYS